MKKQRITPLASRRRNEPSPGNHPSGASSSSSSSAVTSPLAPSRSLANDSLEREDEVEEEEEEEAAGRVLSIQSYVVHGFVGNKAATFPANLLGLEVDAINSVQLSNHKAYPNSATGQILQGEQLMELIAGLEANHLLTKYTHLLTGYMGSVSFLKSLLMVVDKLRKQSPNFIYFCDPVLGDAGKLYVPPEMVRVYREEVVPQADVLLPNQFEIEQLTGRRIATRADAWGCCDEIHDLGVELVVITSCVFEGEAPHVLNLLASHNKVTHYEIRIPVVEGRFSGTGDLFAALLLAWTAKVELAEALENACRTIYVILQRTRRSFLRGKNPRQELCLLQSVEEILNPPMPTVLPLSKRANGEERTEDEDARDGGYFACKVTLL